MTEQLAKKVLNMYEDSYIKNNIDFENFIKNLNEEELQENKTNDYNFKDDDIFKNDDIFKDDKKFNEEVDKFLLFDTAEQQKLNTMKKSNSNFDKTYEDPFVTTPKYTDYLKMPKKTYDEIFETPDSEDYCVKGTKILSDNYEKIDSMKSMASTKSMASIKPMAPTHKNNPYLDKVLFNMPQKSTNSFSYKNNTPVHKFTEGYDIPKLKVIDLDLDHELKNTYNTINNNNSMYVPFTNQEKIDDNIFKYKTNEKNNLKIDSIYKNFELKQIKGDNQPQNVYLTGAPQMSLFHSEYEGKNHTYFHTIEAPILYKINGTNLKVKLNDLTKKLNAHLISHIYLVFAHKINIDKVELIYDGQIMDVFNIDLIEIYKYLNFVPNVNYDDNYIVSLPFYFNKSGLQLPLVAIESSNIELNIIFTPVTGKVIVLSCRDQNNYLFCYLKFSELLKYFTTLSVS